MPLRAGWFVYAALDLGRCPGCPRRVLRGVAPAAYRRHRIVKMLREPQVKDLPQKVLEVTQRAVATGGRDLRLRRVRRQFLQHHRARVLRLGLSWAWLGGQVASGWYFAMAITSNLSLLAPVCVCHCAVGYTTIATVEEESKVHEEDSPPEGPPVGLRGGAWI